MLLKNSPSNNEQPLYITTRFRENLQVCPDPPAEIAIKNWLVISWEPLVKLWILLRDFMGLVTTLKGTLVDRGILRYSKAQGDNGETLLCRLEEHLASTPL
jgi:hypothetical protein